MSMEIDFSKPLSDEERAFLMERGRYADVERSDNAYGTSGDPSLYTGDGTGLREQQVVTGEVARRRKEELLAELAAIEEAEGTGTGDEDEEADDLPPYEALTVKDLDAELKARHLPVTGSKEAKVKALYDHDEAEERAAAERAAAANQQ